MQGVLKEFAKSARPNPYNFNVKGRILIPNENGNNELITEGFFHRIDRRVSETQSDGYSLNVVQRQYVGLRDLVVEIMDRLESGSIGDSEIAGTPIAGETVKGTEKFGYQARAKFIFHDMEENTNRVIEGVHYLNDANYVALVIESEYVQ